MQLSESSNSIEERQMVFCKDIGNACWIAYPLFRSVYIFMGKSYDSLPFANPEKQIENTWMIRQTSRIFVMNDIGMI